MTVSRISFAAPTKTPFNNMSSGGGLAYDSTRRRLVQFGGFLPVSPFTAYNHVFVFDLTQPDLGWYEVFPDGPLPTARSDHGWIYDPDLDRFLLHGGFLATFALVDDTWSLPGDLSAWTELAADGAPGQPTARFGVDMAYDQTRKKTVLFAGLAADFTTELQDVWEHDGTAGTWTDETPGPLPSEWPVERVFHGVGYDDTRGKVVVFGGDQDSGTFIPLNDLWTWGGPTELFIEQGSTVKPPARRANGVFAYHPRLGGMVLHGGGDLTTGYNDTWINQVLTGWRQAHPATVPGNAASFTPASRFDAAGGVVYTAGSENNVGPFPPLHETWVFGVDEEWREPAAGFRFDPVEIDITGGSAVLADPSSVASSTIERIAPTALGSIAGWALTATVPANSRLLVALLLDGVYLYWDGDAWVTSDLTEAERNTPAVVAANITALALVAGGSQLSENLLLISDNAVATPVVFQLEIDGELATIAAAPPRLVTIRGIIDDEGGQLVDGAKLTVTPPDAGYYHEGRLIARAFSAQSDANGEINLDVYETESVGVAMAIALEVGEEIRTATAVIPDRSPIELSELLP